MESWRLCAARNMLNQHRQRSPHMGPGISSKLAYTAVSGTGEPLRALALRPGQKMALLGLRKLYLLNLGQLQARRQALMRALQVR